MKEFSIPTGMRDLILGECESKKELQLKIEDCLSKWGYEEIITPTIEFFRTYDVGFDNIQEENMYKFFDANGRTLMLRADMTIPIARVAATKFKDVKTPLRFRYCANVFKVHEELSGLQSEISDCGVELIGMDEDCAELEILITAMEALQVVKDKKVMLEIGDINFFREACNSLKLNEDKVIQLAKLIDDKNLKALEDYLKELDLSENDQQFFNRLPWMNGNESILEEAKQYAFNTQLISIVERLMQLNVQLKALGYHDVNFDLGKVTNLNYYTGLIFEAYVEGIGARVLSGGSYNTLIGKYGRELTAVGFSIKLDALLEVVKPMKKADRYIIEYPKSMLVDAIKLSRHYREEQTVALSINDSLDKIVVKRGD